MPHVDSTQHDPRARGSAGSSPLMIKGGVMRIEVEQLGVVYEARADDPFGHACEPRIVRLANGTILLSHRAGTRRESADGRPHFLRSLDEGRTWLDLGRPIDPPAAAGWDLRGAG